MTCRDLIEFVADYLSGDLPPDTRLEFERHLDLCSNCVAYLRGYRDTIRLGRHACEDDDGSVPDTVPEELIAAVLSARSKSTRA